jgi:hypothetical protein
MRKSFRERATDSLYQRSQGATFGAFLEFSRNQKESENSRVEPTVLLYDRWYYTGLNAF